MASVFLLGSVSLGAREARDGIGAATQGASSLSPLLPQQSGSGGGSLSYQGSCECRVDNKSQFVFYNRVPKCGSTTMVKYMGEACQAKGDWQGRPWTGFSFVQSTDYDGAHFHPDLPARRRIIEDMSATAKNLSAEARHEGRAVFERHIHFIDFEETGASQPVYLNLLREPSSLRASSFYFFRDCVCNQQPAHGDDYADEWCRSEWPRKSEAFCGTDINTCYADIDACRSAGHSLGGSTLTDFMCGASSDACAEPARAQIGEVAWDDSFARKAAMAVDNILNKYR